MSQTNERRLILAENARETVQTIREGLDVSSSLCGGCSRPHFHNWPHRLVDQKAAAAITKIDGIISELNKLIEYDEEETSAGTNSGEMIR